MAGQNQPVCPEGITGPYNGSQISIIRRTVKQYKQQMIVNPNPGKGVIRHVGHRQQFRRFLLVTELRHKGRRQFDVFPCPGCFQDVPCPFGQADILHIDQRVNTPFVLHQAGNGIHTFHKKLPIFVSLFPIAA